MKIKNLTTGEIVNVSNTNVKDGQIIGRYQFGTRYFNKYGKMLTKVGDTADGEQPILKLADGWQVVNERETKDEPQTARTEATEVTEQPCENTAQPEVFPETKDEPVPEVVVPQPTKPQPVTPSLDAAAQAFAALTPLFSGVEANVTANVMAQLEPMRQQVQAICNRAPQIVEHVIVVNGKPAEKLPNAVYHENFDDVCKRIARGQWVYLYGPTGSGKNVMAEQIADALSLPFHYQAHCSDRFELTGFIDANGNYQPTEFYKAYTEGGLFMLDELDASDENALITLNSAANGYFAFPCGTVRAHENFRCIAAGNTCGRGATEDYTGRRVMDVSSIGRFVPRFHNYCDVIDMHDAEGNEELVAFIHAMRDAKRTTGSQIIASPRQIKTIVADEKQGINLTQTLTDVFAAYLTADELNIVKQYISGIDGMTDNRYAKAFKKVQAVEY